MKQLTCAVLAAVTLAGCGRLAEISRELETDPNHIFLTKGEK